MLKFVKNSLKVHFFIGAHRHQSCNHYVVFCAQLCILVLLFLNVAFSFVEPEPDFLAGAGAGKNSPAPGHYP